MARIRTIKPDFWIDEDINKLHEATQLLAISLLNYADDEGYFNANEMLVKAACCPLRKPSVSINTSLKELSNIGYLKLGKLEQKKYGQIVNFEKHQRVSHKKDSEIKGLEIAWEDSAKTCGRRAEDVRKEEGSLQKEGALNRIELNRIELNVNTNSVSKALPSKKEDPQNKNRVNKDLKNISQNSKPYEKIKQVMDYYNNLKPEQKNLFALGALGLRGHGVPSPLMGSIAMKQLMVLWYDKTVESTGEKRL